MTEAIIQKINDAIPDIPQDTRYWMVRTDGGAHFNFFVQERIVSIGYNSLIIPDLSRLYFKRKALDVSLNDLSNEIRNIEGRSRQAIDKRKTLKEQKKRIKDARHRELKEEIVNLIHSKYEGHNTPLDLFNQQSKFCFEMKKGDFVIIPDEGSHSFYIGKLTRSDAYHRLIRPDDDCGYEKSWSVDWISRIERRLFDEGLHRLTFRHRAIIEIPDSSRSTVNLHAKQVYAHDDKINLVFRINKKSDLKSTSLISAWAEVINIANDFASVNDIDASFDEVLLDIRAESPGHLRRCGRLLRWQN
jgi:restriction system protein